MRIVKSGWERPKWVGPGEPGSPWSSLEDFDVTCVTLSVVNFFVFSGRSPLRGLFINDSSLTLGP